MSKPDVYDEGTITFRLAKNGIILEMRIESSESYDLGIITEKMVATHNTEAIDFITGLAKEGIGLLGTDVPDNED